MTKNPSSSIDMTDKAAVTVAARLALLGGVLDTEVGINGRMRFLVQLRGRVHPFDNICQVETLTDILEAAQ